MSLPIALTCGDPNGIGIDISFEAKKILKNRIPFFLIADIGHIKSRKNSQNFKEIRHPKECLNINTVAIETIMDLILKVLLLDHRQSAHQ